MVIAPIVNSTGTIGQIIIAGTQSVTGNSVATFLFIFVSIMVLGFALKIGLEWLAIIILPLAISLASYYQNFMIAVVIIIFYLASLIAQKWLFR